MIDTKFTRVSCIAFSPVDGLLASAAEPDVKLWDVASGACVAELGGHERGTVCTAFLPDGKTLVTTDLHSIRFWSLDTVSQTSIIPDVIQLLDDAGQVPDAVAILVEKGLQINFVKDGRGKPCV